MAVDKGLKHRLDKLMLGASLIAAWAVSFADSFLCLSRRMLVSLASLIGIWAADRCLVLTGSQDSFAAGCLFACNHPVSWFGFGSVMAFLSPRVAACNSILTFLRSF